MTLAVSVRAVRRGSLRLAVVLLTLIVLSTAPAISPPAVVGASLKDQIGAAQDRQSAIGRSIAQQDSLLKGLQRDQATTQAALRETAADLRGINADQDVVKKRIGRTEAALERVEARHVRLVDGLRQTDNTLQLLDLELAAGEDDLRVRRESLGQRLVEAYRVENTTLLEQVFTADSFSDVLNSASAYLAYGEQDALLADEIRSDQQALDTLRVLTVSTRLQTDKLRRDTVEVQADVEDRRRELGVQKRQLQRLQAKVKRIQGRQEASYRNLVKNEKDAKRIRAAQVAAKRSLQRRISGLVRKAQAQAARRSGSLASSGNGRFIWPTRGTVTQGYGCTGSSLAPSRGSCAGFHDGIDIANAAGTPIRAAGDGVVAYVGYRADGAFVVVMGHAGGFETVYGHMLPRYAVRAGQFVKKGRVIGYMGSTGYSTGNHLHWEVSRGFVTVDPRSYV